MKSFRDRDANARDNRIHRYLAPAVKVKKKQFGPTKEITMDWEALRGITPVSLD